MNLQFEHNLDHKPAAIDAVCGLFTGQELCRTEFTVSHSTPRYGDGQSQDFAGQVVQQQVGLGDQYAWAQELFKTTELLGYLNALQASKLMYESVPYGCEAERHFAVDCEKSQAVKLYVKLPGWFKIPTPLGSYNPDWAMVVDFEGEDRLYFVVETKGSMMNSVLHPGESDKIDCGVRHFEALAVGKNPAKFVKARTLDGLLAQVT